MSLTIRGSLPAIITPMQPDGAVDEGAFRNLIDWHIDEGTDGIVAVGTTGESATLDVDEHTEVIEIAVSQVAGRVPLIAGTGANSTAEALHLTKSAQEAGADAALLVTPYYNRPTQEGLYQHFRTIAEGASIPQILYNVPARTACDMATETTLRLSEIDNIIGIKDATADVPRGVEMMRRAPDGFQVYSGEDITSMDLILGGAVGTISVTANVAPRLMHMMVEAALAGDVAKANEYNDLLIPLHKGLFIESSPTPTKWALAQMGMISSGIRLPLVPLSPECYDIVRGALASAGVEVPDSLETATG